MKADTQPIRLAAGVDIGQGAEQLLEGDRDLPARQVRARDRSADRDLRSRRGRWACGSRRSDLGCREHRLVAIGRPVPQHHLVAFGEDVVAEAGTVGRDGTPEVDHRGRPAHDLVDGGGRHSVEVCLPDGPLPGEAGEQVQAVGDGVAGGLVAGDDQQDEKRRQLGRSELLTVHLRGDQRGRDVVAAALRSRSSPISRTTSASSAPAVSRAPTTFSASSTATYSGSVKPRMTLVRSKMNLSSLPRDAHEVDDHPQRQEGGDLRHKVALAERRDPRHDLGGDL